MALTIQDYMHIVNYCGEPVPESDEQIQQMAMYLLNNSLCRCMKGGMSKPHLKSIKTLKPYLHCFNSHSKTKKCQSESGYKKMI